MVPFLASDEDMTMTDVITELTFVNATTGQETPFLFEEWSEYPCESQGSSYDCLQPFFIPGSLSKVNNNHFQTQLAIYIELSKVKQSK